MRSSKRYQPLKRTDGLNGRLAQQEPAWPCTLAFLLHRHRRPHLGMDGADIFVDAGLVEFEAVAVALIQRLGAEQPVGADHGVRFAVIVLPGDGRAGRDRHVHREHEILDVHRRVLGEGGRGGSQKSGGEKNGFHGMILRPGLNR